MRIFIRKVPTTMPLKEQLILQGHFFNLQNNPISFVRFLFETVTDVKIYVLFINSSILIDNQEGEIHFASDFQDKTESGE